MKILVADDEFFARKAIVQMIQDWDASTLVIEAEDGTTALKIIDEEVPDLLITDIRMPGMDGIQLAAHIRKNHPSTLVTIISGYDDFTYAREAIQYKVENYLLKPVDRQELTPLLKQIKERVADRQETSLEFAMSACFYEEAGRNLPALEAALGSGNYESHTMVFLHHPSQYRELTTIAKEVFLRNNLQTFIMTDKFQPQLLIAWIRSKTASGQGLHDSVHSLCDRINRKLTDITGESCAAIGISSALTDLRQLDVSLKEAKLAALQSFVHGHGKTVRIEHIGNVYHYDAALIQEWTGVFNQKAINHQVTEMAGMIRSWLADSAKKQFSVHMVQDSLAAAVNMINTLIGRANSETASSYIEQRNLFEFTSIHEAGEDLIAKLSTVIEQLKRSEAKRDIVQDIKDFVEANYKNRIVLDDLAKHRYFVDPSYLSRLFKRKCGMGFTQYLLSIRMDKAKKLLESTSYHLPIATVASEVGFNDYSYFIQMYRKVYGATPGKSRSEKNPKNY
ncbi:response regulator [Paenibacillus sp. N3/727]|uniref:response regulator transcription factor n=1 Tax=Paenibacillus sp. N3/727 TaxID=2925845 RepID=UPI001F53427D|nr:response regulator [Paenibacillus sp. N3/727]UNK19013.1 response regulator [Paenibacillus sp. N3/727]